MSDAQWDTLRIPVDMAFFFYSAPAERVVAFYPSPMGTDGVALEAWRPGRSLRRPTRCSKRWSGTWRRYW
jgi:hypothetical protein